MNKRISTLCYSLSGAICAGVFLLPAPVWAQADDDSARVSLTTLHSFNYIAGGGPSVGGGPSAGLVEGSHGYFYGTTAFGGTNQLNTVVKNRLGSVFKISSTGEFTSLHSFDGLDGAVPDFGLTLGSDGYFYGTTPIGGTNRPNDLFLGFGTVFKISSDGVFTILHNFNFNPGDGREPSSGLVEGNDGYFYGTTLEGGTNGNGYYQWGTVFKISPDGTFANLYTFTGENDGAFPYAAYPFGGLVQGADGYFYGTTQSGPRTYTGTGYGTVFKISPDGTFTSLYTFTGGSDGGVPNGGLVQGRDGYFYGTTLEGGTNRSNRFPGWGTVFKIGPDGTFTSLYTFTGGSDGGVPNGGLVQGSDGYFYGTAGGGVSNSGTVFKISPDGTFTSLYSFTGGSDGAGPNGGLVQGSDGYFYGTTFGGGAGHAGTVFRLSVPLEHRFHEPHGRSDDPGKRVGP